MSFTWERFHPQNVARDQMELTLFADIAGSYRSRIEEGAYYQIQLPPVKDRWNDN